MRFFLTAVFLLTACGKPVVSVAPSRTLTFGTLEVMECPGLELLKKVTPRLLPGGIVTHYEAECVAVSVP